MIRMLLDAVSDDQREAFLSVADQSGRKAIDYACSESASTLLTKFKPCMTLNEPMAIEDGSKSDGLVIDSRDIAITSKLASNPGCEIFAALLNGQPVALKRFLTESRPSFHNTPFLREIAALRRASHTNIVKLLGVVAESHSLVLELCKGGSLFDSIRGQFTLTITQKYKILLDVAKAVQYLHFLELVHRNIKSLNVLLTEKVCSEQQLPSAKLTDFGLARVLDINRPSSPGTHAFMAPEMCSSGHYDEKVDVYSFGMLCFELATGETPFEKDSTALIAQNTMNGLRPYCDDKMDSNLKMLMQKCWQQNAAERPSFARITHTVSEFSGLKL